MFNTDHEGNLLKNSIRVQARPITYNKKSMQARESVQPSNIKCNIEETCHMIHEDFSLVVPVKVN